MAIKIAGLLLAAGLLYAAASPWTMKASPCMGGYVPVWDGGYWVCQSMTPTVVAGSILCKTAEGTIGGCEKMTGSSGSCECK